MMMNETHRADGMLLQPDRTCATLNQSAYPNTNSGASSRIRNTSKMPELCQTIAVPADCTPHGCNLGDKGAANWRAILVANLRPGQRVTVFVDELQLHSPRFLQPALSSAAVPRPAVRSHSYVVWRGFGNYSTVPPHGSSHNPALPPRQMTVLEHGSPGLLFVGPRATLQANSSSSSIGDADIHLPMKTPPPLGVAYGLFNFAPIMSPGGWVLLGEKGKYVAMSGERFISVNPSKRRPYPCLLVHALPS
jgi:hypothetical protein